MSRYVSRGALIAALYIVITFALKPFSFGPWQFRASEALTVLPILWPEAIPGLYIGCFLANILGGLGPWDIFGGSAVTLLAAYITYHYRRSFLAYLSPIVLNAFLVSLYLAPILGLPYWSLVLSLGVSEAVVVLGLGWPLVKLLHSARL
ncbi:MAG: QueT transporter family protein [Firmicutes bacterium]|nr:QueT transporter family protein [Bacillota bacterium]MCL5038504.1 QueT transporter family protein [Bacillota bacterium]